MGIHTPKKTIKVLDLFKKHCKLDFIDGSYGNDEADSLHHEIAGSKTEHLFLTVFVPNIKGGYKDYFVTNQDRDELLLTENVCEVIQYLNTNY